MNDRPFSHLTRRAALGLLASAAFAPRLAHADVPAAFPKGQVTLIVPFTPGGPVDVLGRMLAHEYQQRSRQTVVVENRTGGAGNIGIDIVKNAKPDGTTLLLIPAGNLTINPTLMPNLSFNVAQDFAPIALLASAPNVIVVSPKLGVTTVKEFIAKAKSQKLSYGSPGVGSQLHLAMELLKDKAGIDIQHVPYRGSPQALQDLLGGHIDVLASNLPAVLPGINDKTIVPIAMTTAQRSELVPTIPTLAESGVEGIDVTSWYGMLAPHAIALDVRDALFAVARDIMMSSDLRAKLLAQGLTVAIEAPGPFAERIARETALWAGVIKSRNITIQQ